MQGTKSLKFVNAKQVSIIYELNKIETVTSVGFTFLIQLLIDLLWSLHHNSAGMLYHTQICVKVQYLHCVVAYEKVCRTLLPKMTTATNNVLLYPTQNSASLFQ